MNKRRFIERLNLYLDDELSEEECGKLLHSIRRNREYQRIYVQYCQIHNACRQLGQFAPEQAAASGNTALRQGIYAVGGMAAAIALLALAANNLSPYLSNDGLGNAAIASEGQSSVGDNLLVVDVANLNQDELDRVSNFEPARFDVGSAFDARSEALAVGGDALQLVQYTTAENAAGQESSLSRADFSFSDAVTTSTFEHELLVAEEASRLFAEPRPSLSFSSDRPLSRSFLGAANARETSESSVTLRIVSE